MTIAGMEEGEMSQDKPKQPAQAKPKSRTPKPPTADGGGVFNLKFKQILKGQSIKTLRGTIGLLEGVVEKLEAEPLVQVPPASPPATALSEATVTSVQSTTVAESIAAEVTPSTVAESIVAEVTPSTVVESIAAEVTPSVEKGVAVPGKGTFLESFQALWELVLQKIRSLLPRGMNEKLSNTAIGGSIAVIAILVLLTTPSLFSQKSVDVAKTPPALVETPPELVAPKPPEPVEISPPTNPAIAPKQTLIAAIQDEVAQITNEYAEGLIQSIEANFQGGLLSVKITDGWYNLSESQQDKLAAAMLARCRELDFSKLKMVDLQGKLLARNPVVGDNMVILKRKAIAT